MTLPTDPDCYWVEPGKLVAGEYPGAYSERQTRRKLRALIDCGVRTFVDLTEPGELEAYDHLLEKEARAAGVTVRYHRHPVVDLDVPTAEEMRGILDVIDAAVDTDAPVYVHCWGGIGRTGTVVCCWLIERGRTCDQALVDITLLREHIQKRLIASPEMETQRAFVKMWKKSDL
jgi:protein-tyrosine phosphatase